MIFLLSHCLFMAGITAIYTFAGRLNAVFRYGFLRWGLGLSFLAPAAAAYWPYDVPPILPVQNVNPNISWPLWLLAIYCLAAGWKIGRVIFSYVQLRAYVHRLPIMGREGRITLRTGESPFAFGLLLRTIVLPPGADELLLCHERIHARRFDPLWLFVVEIGRSLFFFSPLHRYFGKSFELEMELSCDELVLKNWPLKRRAYAELLLAFATGSNVAYSHMALSASRSNLSRRIESMSQLKRNHPLRVAAAVLSLGCVAFVVSAFTVTAVAQPTVEQIFGNRSMSLQAKKTGVRSLLEFVLQAQHVKYKISPDTGDRLVSVSVKDAHVAEIFNFLITSGSLSCVVGQDGALQIGPGKMSK